MEEVEGELGKEGRSQAINSVSRYHGSTNRKLIFHLITWSLCMNYSNFVFNSNGWGPVQEPNLKQMASCNVHLTVLRNQIQQELRVFHCDADKEGSGFYVFCSWAKLQ